MSYALIVYFVCYWHSFISFDCLYTWCWVDGLQCNLVVGMREIVSVQFKEEMNIWSRATFATTTHNNQPPTLRLGEEDTSYKQIAIVCNNTASFWLETWAWMCIRKSTQRIELKNNDNSQLWDWQRQYTIEGRISLIPITQPYLDSSCNEICKWKRVDWNNILREQDNLRCGHRRGEIALT